MAEVTPTARPEASAPPPPSRRFPLNPMRLWEAEGELTAIEMAEGGLLADLGVLINLASIYIPLLGGAIAMAAPTPFVLLMMRRGWRSTVLATIVASFLVTVISGPHFGWRMGTQALAGLFIGLMMRRKVNPWLVILSVAVLIALALFLATMSLIFLAGLPVHDVVQELQNAFNSVSAGASGAAQITGQSGTYHQILPAYNSFAAFAIAYWPLMLFLAYYGAAVATAALYYLVAETTLRVLGFDVRVFPPRWMERPVRDLANRFDHREERPAGRPERGRPERGRPERGRRSIRAEEPEGSGTGQSE